MNNNEKIISLDAFEPRVPDGPVKFLVLDGRYDELETKNGKREILKLDLELQELHNSNKKNEKKSINLFVDYNQGSFFHQFVQAVVEGAFITAFQPSKLINLKGQATLSHYQPEGYKFGFPQLSDWVFYQSNQKLTEALEKYQEDDMNFNIDEDDINFGDDEDGETIV